MRNKLFFCFISFSFFNLSCFSDKLSEKNELPNPASLFCEENQGEVKIVSESDGEKGYCVFNNDKKCEEWEFYRGECLNE